jgi:hypothetical protein
MVAAWNRHPGLHGIIERSFDPVYTSRGSPRCDKARAAHVGGQRSSRRPIDDASLRFLNR